MGSAGILCWEIIRIFRDLRFWENHGIRFCKADSFVVTDTILTKGWVVFPICLLFFYAAMEKESVQTLIRFRGRKDVYFSRMGTVVLLAMFTAGIETVGIVCANVFLNRPAYNWDQPYSVFQVNSGGKLPEGTISYMKVAGIFFLSSAGGILFLGIVFLFLRSLLCSSKAALIGTLSGVVLRICIQDRFQNSGIWYTQWLHYNNRLLAFEIVVGGVLMFLGYAVIRKKDLI